VKVLVTGGFGFLGGRFAQYLYGKGYDILLGSRKKQKIPDWLSQAVTVQIDWEDQDSLVEVCNAVDVIIHTAGMNAQECTVNPQHALVVNGVYTKRLIDAASKQGVRKFIYLSTAHVYASPLEGSFNEQSPTTNMHPYATTHLAGEKAVLEISGSDDIDGIILRLSNAFGAPAHQKANCWGLLVNDLCRQAVTKNKLVLKSAGTQMRDFIPIEDVCHIVRYLIENIEKNAIVNVGSGKSCTVYEMVQKIQRCCVGLWGGNYPIVVPEITETRNLEHLDYQMNFLHKNKYEVRGNFEKELKSLLEFCYINFS